MDSKNPQPQAGLVLLDSKVKRAINNKSGSAAAAAPVLSKVIESQLSVVAPVPEQLSNIHVISAEVESSVGGGVVGDEAAAAKNVGAQINEASALSGNLGGSDASAAGSEELDALRREVVNIKEYQALLVRKSNDHTTAFDELYEKHNVLSDTLNNYSLAIKKEMVANKLCENRVHGGQQRGSVFNKHASS